MKVCDNPPTPSFKGIIRGNEIDSLCPISDDLITGLLLQGFLGEVLHAELVPSCSHTQSSALCQLCLLCPFQSYLVSGGPSGSLSHPPPPGPRMPLPCLHCCWGECNACIGGPRVHRAFSLSDLRHGWGYKLFAWSCHGQALLQWKHLFFTPGGPQ